MRPKRTTRVTLQEVASAAGVSLSTASKALNGRSDVNEDTRVKVQESAALMGFTPNTVAQQLAFGRTRSVGLITSDLEGRFSLPILKGAENALDSEHMSVLLSDAQEDSQREKRHVEALLARNVDGLIVVGERTDPRPSLGQDFSVPLVYTYAPSEDPADMSLVCDNVGAGELVAQHLIATGRRHIAVIHGDPSYLATHDRAEGISRALTQAGLSPTGGFKRFGSWSEAWGRAATEQVCAEHASVDAFICGSDQIARGCLDSLARLGRSVPTQIAVASFDNWEILATGSDPQLTTVDMNFEAMGRAAALAIINAIAGELTPGIHTQACRLIVRGSTVPA